MTDEQQAPDTGGWQDGLDAALVARLTRPLVQPGVIRSDLADGILTRTERMANRLPLLGEVMSRLRPEGQRVIPTVPIVYAAARRSGFGPRSQETPGPRSHEEAEGHEARSSRSLLRELRASRPSQTSRLRGPNAPGPNTPAPTAPGPAGEAPFVVAEGRVDAGLDYRPSLPVVRAGAVVASVSPVPPTGLTATRASAVQRQPARGAAGASVEPAQSQRDVPVVRGSILAELKGVEKALRVSEGAAAPQGAAAGVGTDAGALVVVRRHPISAAPAAVHRPVESVASAASARQRDATAEPLLAPAGAVGLVPAPVPAPVGELPLVAGGAVVARRAVGAGPVPAAASPRRASAPADSPYRPALSRPLVRVMLGAPAATSGGRSPLVLQRAPAPQPPSIQAAPAQNPVTATVRPLIQADREVSAPAADAPGRSIDVDAITERVLRKLQQRLSIERERRGLGQ